MGMQENLNAKLLNVGDESDFMFMGTKLIALCWYHVIFGIVFVFKSTIVLKKRLEI